MSARSFGSLFMVASCAGAALGCYLVSLRVASERAQLEDVESKIVLAQEDMRVLQTEIGTRGRLSQLERWNAGAFELSAPAANQILEGSFQLAQLVQPQKQVDFHAPVVLASAPAPTPEKAIGEPVVDDSGAAAAPPQGTLLHEASLKTETREVPAPLATVAMPQPAAKKSADRPVSAAKPGQSRSADKPGLAAAQSHVGKAKPAAVHTADASKKSVDKPALGAVKPMTKRVQVAKVDPLAPLPEKHSVRTRVSTTDR
jgi:hypothetical protein